MEEVGEFTPLDQKIPEVEYIVEGDTVIMLIDGKKKGRLNFSIGMTDTGLIQAFVHLMITQNFHYSRFDNPRDVCNHYTKYIRDLVIGSEKIPDLGLRLMVYFIEYAKRKGCKVIILEPDSIKKQVYWREKIGNKLVSEGIIKGYDGREEICFRL